jgi:hypothetical protein
MYQPFKNDKDTKTKHHLIYKYAADQPGFR